VELKLAIQNAIKGDIDSPCTCAQSELIQTSLQWAIKARSNTKQDILTTVADMLGCKAVDLRFLFRDDKADPQIYSLDLPDYRLRRSEIYLEAAE